MDCMHFAYQRQSVRPAADGIAYYGPTDYYNTVALLYYDGGGVSVVRRCRRTYCCMPYTVASCHARLATAKESHRYGDGDPFILRELMHACKHAG